jgi:hypothetical protein
MAYEMVPPAESEHLERKSTGKIKQSLHFKKPNQED